MSKLTLLLSNLVPQRLERKARDFRDLYLRHYKLEKLPPEIYSKDLKYYTISFCTTCMNRLFHLQQTIIKNMEDNLDYPNVEFVLINYNSQDGLDAWAQRHLKKYVEEGILNYYHTTEPQFFHVCKAKNLAHKAAKGDIIVNLDGDNFTGEDYAFYINYLFNKKGFDNLYHFRKSPYWGTEGRIVLSKEKFVELGGYDESFHPTGHEDYDLINRAKAYGLGYENIQVENFLRYLSNTTKEKSSNFEDENAYFYDYESSNRKKSNDNITANRLIANKDGWATMPVYKNFSKEAIYL